MRVPRPGRALALVLLAGTPWVLLGCDLPAPEPTRTTLQETVPGDTPPAAVDPSPPAVQQPDLPAAPTTRATPGARTTTAKERP